MVSREAYVRSVVKTGKIDAVIGLEWREGDSLDNLRKRLKLLADIALSYLLPEDDDYEIACLLEYRLKAWWPDRAYFLEVCSDGVELDWIQIYQPFGLPRVDSTHIEGCTCEDCDELFR